MPSSPLMPALFIGHGSPMNIILDNAYTRSLSALSAQLPKPRAIIAFSAHWETAHTELLALANPKTIYDFGGFPQLSTSLAILLPELQSSSKRFWLCFPIMP